MVLTENSSLDETSEDGHQWPEGESKETRKETDEMVVWKGVKKRNRKRGEM